MADYTVTVCDRDGGGFRLIKVRNVPRPVDAVTEATLVLSDTEVIDSVWLRVWP